MGFVDRYPTGYELKHGGQHEAKVPSYPAEVLTEAQIAYDQRVKAAQEMGEAMAQNVRGLRLMQEAREARIGDDAA